MFFVITQQHWSQSAVGLMTALDGLLGLILKTPIGAAIDSTHAKRGINVAALATIAITAATIAATPSFWPSAASSIPRRAYSGAMATKGRSGLSLRNC